MDRRERSGDMLAGIMAAFEGHQSSLWTALPGIVQSFDPIKQTCNIQPAIQGKVQSPDGSFKWVTMPLLLDCPVFFPSGGGVTLTFPVAVGDECLAVFASRCIDAWWQLGCPLDSNGKVTVQVQAEMRMHDLSDGFAFVGFASNPKVIANISTTKAQLRNATGSVMVEVDPTGTMTIAAPTVNINGTLIINGAPYLSHHHSNVTPGVGTTGNVV